MSTSFDSTSLHYTKTKTKSQFKSRSRKKKIRVDVYKFHLLNYRSACICDHFGSGIGSSIYTGSGVFKGVPENIKKRKGMRVLGGVVVRW